MSFIFVLITPIAYVLLVLQIMQFEWKINSLSYVHHNLYVILPGPRIYTRVRDNKYVILILAEPYITSVRHNLYVILP